MFLDLHLSIHPLILRLVAAGGMMGNKNMEQKGMEKREQQGYGGDSSNY